MTTRAAKTAATAAAAGDEKKPDELTPESTVDEDGGQNTAAGSDDTGVNLTRSETNGAVGLTGAGVTRKAALFLGPYHRYSCGDTAYFDAECTEKPVEHHIVVWPEDVEKVLSLRKGTNDHDIDTG